MVHPQFGFALFQALLNGPAKPTEPNKRGQSGAEWGIAGKIAVDRFFAQGAADNQTDFFIRQTLVREDHLSFGKFIFNRAFGPLGEPAPIPKDVMDVFGQLLDRDSVIGDVVSE
jgi:hypothetical protein